MNIQQELFVSSEVFCQRETALFCHFPLLTPTAFSAAQWWQMWKHRRLWWHNTGFYYPAFSLVNICSDHQIRIYVPGLTWNPKWHAFMFLCCGKPGSFCICWESLEWGGNNLKPDRLSRIMPQNTRSISIPTWARLWVSSYDGKSHFVPQAKENYESNFHQKKKKNSFHRTKKLNCKYSGTT